MRHPLLTIHYSLPQNKKPGVERRVQPLTLEWLHAKLDRFLARARRYLTIGSGFGHYRSDRESPVMLGRLTQTPEPLVSILNFRHSSSPSQTFFTFTVSFCANPELPALPEMDDGPQSPASRLLHGQVGAETRAPFRPICVILPNAEIELPEFPVGCGFALLAPLTSADS